ncbi:MAG: hypothetical protein MI975_19075 [Cytophagales bacterium]|nr:hypothetical protein [Cytophagales bacterium]
MEMYKRAALIVICIITTSLVGNAEVSNIEGKIREALTLSHLLKFGSIIDVENDLHALGFEVYKNSNNKDSIFFKYLDDNQREVFSISIHDDKAISISHYHFDEGSGFANKVRSKFIESDFFERGENKDEFIFCFPVNESDNLLDTLNCKYQSKILFNDVVITFFVPSIASEDEDWIAKILELTL